ncbi:MAG: RidA family protein [Clostridiales bacterium]|nr:RidA family protein [Clostridiales bacterium]
MKKQIICKEAPPAIGPYSQAIHANGMLFIAGQLPISPETGKVVDGIETQTRQVLENIKAIITTAGGTMDNIVKCNVFLLDMADFAAMNGIYKEYFNEPAPARATVAVAGLPPNVIVEIEAVAVL